MSDPAPPLSERRLESESLSIVGPFLLLIATVTTPMPSSLLLLPNFSTRTGVRASDRTHAPFPPFLLCKWERHRLDSFENPRHIRARPTTTHPPETCISLLHFGQQCTHPLDPRILFLTHTRTQGPRAAAKEAPRRALGRHTGDRRRRATMVSWELLHGGGPIVSRGLLLLAGRLREAMMGRAPALDCGFCGPIPM